MVLAVKPRQAELGVFVGNEHSVSRFFASTGSGVSLFSFVFVFVFLLQVC